MALSGSFTGSILSGNYKLRVDWSATQNVSGNTSKVTCVMYLVQASSWGLSIASRSDNSTTINGTKYTWTSPAISNGGGKTTKLATVTSGNIAHNADGTKSITISSTFQLNATISGTYRDTITASATITLNTIPRATQPSLSASSADMGAAVTVSMPRASSAFTHDLAYKVGSGSYVAVASGQATTYAWAVPDVASQIPNDTSVKLTLRCITKRGSTTIGTKYTYLTAKVPSSVVPTVGNVSVTEATSGLAAQFGAFIQNKSKLGVTIGASGAKGSTIKAFTTTLLGKTYTGSAWTSGVITSKGTVSLVTKVQDSRGRWSASKTTSITVLEYSTPQVNTLLARRVNASGEADEQGSYISVQYKYSVTSLGSKNTASMVIEYKKSSETTWTSLLTGTALSANTTAKPTSPTFSTDYQYDVRITVTDWFKASRTYTTVLPSGAVILDLLANGKGISFGKTADSEGVDFGWDIVGFNAVAGAGRVKIGGLLIQWGNVDITPSAANTATTVVVTFPVKYKATPTVLATPVTGAPDVVHVGVQRNSTLVGGDNTAAMAVTLVRGNTTTTSISWLAIGLG